MKHRERADVVPGGSIIHATVEGLRGDGLNLDFWRGVGSLRVCERVHYSSCALR